MYKRLSFPAKSQTYINVCMNAYFCKYLLFLPFKMHINIARYEMFRACRAEKCGTTLALSQLCPLHDSRTYSAMKIICVSLEKPFLFPFFFFFFCRHNLHDGNKN